MKTHLAAALVLGLAMAPACAWAQGDKSKSGDSSKPSDTQSQTICGVVAGVTVEGETAFDFSANRAVTVEAAYMTVVGSPKMSGEGHSGDKDKSGDKNKSGVDKKRDNIYIVWLSPRTKVCECSDSSGKSDSKKDISLDRLEVGDRVEVQFARRDESHSGGAGTQGDKAKSKHGRHRIYVGDANAITIMPPKDDDQSGSDSKSSEGSKSSEKDSGRSK